MKKFSLQENSENVSHCPKKSMAGTLSSIQFSTTFFLCSGFSNLRIFFNSYKDIVENKSIFFQEEAEPVQQSSRSNNNSQPSRKENNSSRGSVTSFSTSRSLPLINAKKSAAKIFWKRGRASQEDTVAPVKNEITGKHMKF